VECFSMLVWLGMNGCCRKSVARSDNLAQASLSRLGEMSRGSPRPFYARGRWGNQLKFERASVLPKRECAEATVVCVELSPRRRELAWARVLLTWARPSNLSEELGENASRVGFPLFLDV